MVSNKVINLLWTGGWDSTFRLLSLVLDQKRIVQPHYLIDSERLSTRKELFTIRSIKQKLFMDYPFTKSLILPTQIVEISDLKPDYELRNAFQDILSRIHIGTQYGWLSNYCKQFGIIDMEICSCVTPDTGTALIVGPYLEKVEYEGLFVYRLRSDSFEKPEGQLFKYFHFPLFTLTKLLMQDKAKEKGWTELMNMTWFCHKPTRKQKPCGICAPCQIAVHEGMGWRIPVKNRIVGFFVNSLKKSKLFLLIKKIKSNN